MSVGDCMTPSIDRSTPRSGSGPVIESLPAHANWAGIVSFVDLGGNCRDR
jgi:hypothetical protein